MPFLITGGFGFIGSAVVRRLLSSSDETIINIDKMTYAASPAALGMHVGEARHIHIAADICDVEAMRAAFATHRPSAVMHLAAESHVDRSIDGPAEFIRTNVVGTQVLLEAAREHWNTLDAAAKAAEAATAAAAAAVAAAAAAAEAAAAAAAAPVEAAAEAPAEA